MGLGLKFWMCPLLLVGAGNLGWASYEDIETETPRFFSQTQTLNQYKGVTRLGEFGVSKCRITLQIEPRNPALTRFTYFYAAYPQSYLVSTSSIISALNASMGHETLVSFSSRPLLGDDKRPADITLKRGANGNLLEAEVKTAAYKDELRRAHERFNPAGIFPSPYRCLRLN